MSKRHLIGTISSVKMHETAAVTVERQKRHRLYGKRFRVTSSYMSHNPKNEFEVGDIVEIEEHRPYSKTKHWLIRRRVGTALVNLETSLPAEEIIEPTTTPVSEPAESTV